MQQSKLFCILPDYVCTPDGMEIDQYGNLVLSCPNFADDALSGCVVKIDKAGNVKKWFDVPVLEETGVADANTLTMIESQWEKVDKTLQ